MKQSPYWMRNRLARLLEFCLVSSNSRSARLAPSGKSKEVRFYVWAFVVYVAVNGTISALKKIDVALRDAIAMGQTNNDSTQLKGGEARQKGSGRKGSLVRPGGPLSSDDLRRRLYELRETRPERKASLTRNVGGQNGE